MYDFIGFVLYDCGMVGLMKNAEIQYPKLFIHATKNDNAQLKAKYFSNRSDHSGGLKEESILLDSFDVNVSIKSILIQLNRIELKKLDIFISRQEKVIFSYKSKGKWEQHRIVSDSLDTLIEFRSRFKNWFDKMECSV